MSSLARSHWNAPACLEAVSTVRISGALESERWLEIIPGPSFINCVHSPTLKCFHLSYYDTTSLWTLLWWLEVHKILHIDDNICTCRHIHTQHDWYYYCGCQSKNVFGLPSHLVINWLRALLLHLWVRLDLDHTVRKVVRDLLMGRVEFFAFFSPQSSLSSTIRSLRLIWTSPRVTITRLWLKHFLIYLHGKFVVPASTPALNQPFSRKYMNNWGVTI